MVMSRRPSLRRRSRYGRLSGLARSPISCGHTGFRDDREFVTVEVSGATFVIVDIAMRMLTPREGPSHRIASSPVLMTIRLGVGLALVFQIRAGVLRRQLRVAPGRVRARPRALRCTWQCRRAPHENHLRRTH